ncbi:MAG: epimerase, partial [Anaerolineae bacterium]
DYIFVDDVVEAMMTAATVRGINRAVINIGRGQETSVVDLIRAIEGATGKRANVIHNSAKPGGVPRLAADIERARQLLDFQPKVDLKQGLGLILERDSRFRV